MILWGWFDFAFIYKGFLLNFLKKKYFLVNSQNDTSKMPVSMRFVSIVIEKPSFLNTERVSSSPAKYWANTTVNCGKAIASV